MISGVSTTFKEKFEMASRYNADRLEAFFQQGPDAVSGWIGDFITVDGGGKMDALARLSDNIWEDTGIRLNPERLYSYVSGRRGHRMSMQAIQALLEFFVKRPQRPGR